MNQELRVSSAAGSSGYVMLLSLVAAMGGFLFGFDSGVINGTVEALQKAFGASQLGTGWSVASVLLGCAAGALVAGNLADRFGRRPIMMLTALGFSVSAWGSGVASGQTEFVIYRLLGGIAVGGVSVLAPAYIAEIAPPHLRGRLASLQQLGIVTGLLAAFLSNYALVDASGSAEAPFLMNLPTWRWMFWVELVPSTLFLVGLIFVPESPLYLLSVRGREASGAVLRRTVGGDVEGQLDAMQRSLSGATKGRMSDVLQPGTSRLRPVVWAGIGICVFQQFVGINVIFYYGATLWQAAGFTEAQALTTNLITGITNIVSTLIAMALIDKIGRRPLLIIGSLGMAVTLGIIALAFGQAQLVASTTHPGQTELLLTKGQSLVALAAANLYILAFGISWGPVVWVMISEMFGNSYRGAAMSLAASCQWVANFLVTITFPLMLGGLGLSLTYGTYAFAAVLSLFLVLKGVKETKGRRLEEAV